MRGTFRHLIIIALSSGVYPGLLFLFVVLRVKFFCTLGADAMGEIPVMPVQNGSFYLLPVSPIVPYLVTIGTNRQQPVDRL